MRLWLWLQGRENIAVRKRRAGSASPGHRPQPLEPLIGPLDVIKVS